MAIKGVMLLHKRDYLSGIIVATGVPSISVAARGRETKVIIVFCFNSLIIAAAFSWSSVLISFYKGGDTETRVISLDKNNILLG